ncbi:MAG: hypothetical protein GY754_46270 [bacterium]|nr:hypothetical protein [bacterium]
MKKGISIAFMGLAAAMILAFSGCEAGLSQGNSSDDTGDHFSFSDMYTKMKAMQEEINSLKNTNGGLTTRIAELEDTLSGVSRAGDSIVFSGVNVQIVSGTGSTEGAVNGLGNLIVGYNEARTGDFNATIDQEKNTINIPLDNTRTGSHNIIVGMMNNYSSYGGIVAGKWNSSSNIYASVTGGSVNRAVGEYASISGGYINTADGPFSSVSGGCVNKAGSDYASVSGGWKNTASNHYASVTGGYYNTASAGLSSISGGAFNSALSNCSSISGGSYNSTHEDYSSVSGGYSNKAYGHWSSVSGGANNGASGDYSTITGGQANDTTGDHSIVLGGYNKLANTQYQVAW